MCVLMPGHLVWMFMEMAAAVVTFLLHAGSPARSILLRKFIIAFFSFGRERYENCTDIHLYGFGFKLLQWNKGETGEFW